jgi:uncharacterized protein (DUF58 family)
VTVLPTTRLILCAGAFAIASFAALFVPSALVAIGPAYLGFAGFVAADWWWLRKNLHALHVEFTVPPSVTLGDPIVYRLNVANRSDKVLPLLVRPLLPGQGQPPLHVFETNAGSRSVTSFSLNVDTRMRGDHHFGDVIVRWRAPLGLLEGQRRFEKDAVCKVYPDIDSVKDYIVTRRMRQLAAPHIRTARLRGIGSEFESLRDYDEGDDVRRIDWKATARHSKPIIRNYEIEHFRNVLIVVDRGRLMCGKAAVGTKFDAAVNATLMLSAVALDSGDRAGLMVFDEGVVSYLPPRSGMQQLHNVIETLYDVQPNLSESHFRRAFIYLQTRLTKRSLVIVLSDVMDIDASASLIHGVLSLARRHLVVFAALRTPEIEQVIQTPGDDAEAPFRKAVAVRLMGERTDVMARINKGGAHVLDLRPDELTMPVVNKYIELREQNLL